MTRKTFKSFPFYQDYIRPSLWAPIRAHRWVYRSYLEMKRDRHLASIAVEETKLLTEARAKFEYLYASNSEPLVTITVATYNRARLLADVVLPAALAQTYRNIEIIIIGDHCTDETPELMSKVKDARVRFYNLPKRQKYPRNKTKQWRVSGNDATKLAHDMARGLWIAHLDDDDVFTPDHVETLLNRAYADNLEFVSGRCRVEVRPGQWVERGSLIRKVGTTVEGHVSHSTVFRRTYTKLFTADRCLETDLAGDIYRWRKMLNAGVRIGFVDSIVTLQPLRPGEQERSMQFYFSQC